MYKLLIADDEELEREALHYFVKQSNLEIGTIIQCVNGTETVKKVMLEKPDIIILDINMPGLNGLEVMERIKIVNNHCKIILSTAFNYFEYALKALQLGAMDFLVKPVKKELLITVLNKAIDQLDIELEEKSRAIRMKAMITMMGNRIIGELIRGNITEEVLYYLETIGIETGYCGNCFSLRLQTECEQEKKHQILNTMKEEFNLIGLHVILNWKNCDLTLIVFHNKHLENKTVCSTVKKILSSILKKQSLRYLIGVGYPFEDINQIERSYSYARGMIGDLQVDVEEDEDYIDDIPTNIKKVCNFIEKNYSKKISLDDIADSVGFSKYHISRLFKQYMGTTIINYLIQVRITKARELLKEGNYSIKQISTMIGYSDPNYFTWTFKKLEGISPVQYRYSNK